MQAIAKLCRMLLASLQVVTAQKKRFYCLMFLLTNESATHTQTYIRVYTHIKLLTLHLNRGDFDPINIFVKRSLDLLTNRSVDHFRCLLDLQAQPGCFHKSLPAWLAHAMHEVGQCEKCQCI